MGGIHCAKVDTVKRPTRTGKVVVNFKQISPEVKSLFSNTRGGLPKKSKERVIWLYYLG